MVDNTTNSAGTCPTPSLIVVNAPVWTGVAHLASAMAVAVNGARIAAVGTEADVRALAGPTTKIIDAGGRLVIPGITDSHVHLLMYGLAAAQLDLSGVAGREEFVTAVAERAAASQPGQWVLGGRYAAEHWERPEQPRKEWLDQVTPGNPVYLMRADLHHAVVNSPALALAGITRDGPADPPGGTIERDPASGEPTGVLKEAAIEFVQRHIPPPTADEQRSALDAACSALHRWGITSVHDMSLPEELEAYQAFRAAGRLPVRIHSFVTAVDFEEAWPVVASLRRGDEFLRAVGFKAFMDGSLGSRMAHMREPFIDAAPEARYPRGMRSKWATDWEAFGRSVRWAHDRGVQVAIHAIGDQAVSDLLDLYASLPDVQTRRHRIEHVQHLAPEDVSRFAQLGVIASMQPTHKVDDGPWAAQAIGEQRLQMMYAWGSLLRAGATICFGSDAPVATPDPFVGLASAATGWVRDGSVCTPQQNIDLPSALRAYTSVPPYAVFREHELGSIEPGKLADLAILDRNPLDANPGALGETGAFATIVGGRVVWAADETLR